LRQQAQEFIHSKSNSDRQIQHLNEVVADLTDKLAISDATIISQNKTIENLKTQSLLYSDIKSFIQDDSTKDFYIQIDDHQFPVHKFLIAARSPALAEVLKNNPEVGNLKLVDITVEVFEKILKFFYTDELSCDDETNFLHFFIAAGKLKIKGLMNFASKKVIDQLVEENAIDIFKLGFKYDNEEMRQKAFLKIKERYPKINFKDEWAADAEKVMKVIEISMKKEEAIRKIEEEYESLLNSDS
jgi:hypothetical protein